MVLALLHLVGLEEMVCQPELKYFPDPNQRKELYLTNLNNLRSITDFLIIYISMNLFLSFPLPSHIFWTSLCGFHLILLVLFCRTRLWIWHWSYTLGLTLIQYLLSRFINGSLIYALSATFITPLFAIQLNSDIKTIVAGFLGQIFLLHFQYKSMLQEVLLELSPTEFADKFINSATLILIGSTVIYGLRSNLVQGLHAYLNASKKEAEQACSQLTMFLHTFSHELRNPLNSLLGNLDLVMHENLSPRAHEMIDTAKVCADLLLQLINNILDTGKAQLGRLDFNPAPTRIVDFVSGVWRMSRDLIKRKKLNGYLKIDRRMPTTLFLDFYRVNQILLNLMSNALKFTEKGQIWIKFSWLPNRQLSEQCFQPYPYDADGVFDKEHNIRAIFRSTEEADHIIYLESSLDLLNDLYKQSNQVDEHGVLKIIVRDTGPGIKKEDLNFLFTKFGQVTEDPMKREMGTGLGLYITKEICKIMGGDIRAYTKVGIGTTFIVCIPTYCPVQKEATASPTELMTRLRQQKIQTLIADDNIFNLELLSNYVLKIDGKVLENAKNGQEGYERYVELRNSKHRLQVVFIDIDMPIMDGIAMCKQIREYETNHRLPPVKIVLTSGYYEEAQVNRLLDKNGRLRADNFLKKPISFEVFINTLGNFTGSLPCFSLNYDRL